MSEYKTIKVSSLSPSILAAHGLDLDRVRLIVSDIDYTLIDMSRAHDDGIKAIIPIIGIEFANEVSRIFHLILQGHRYANDVIWDGREEYRRLMILFDSLQENIIPHWGRRPWSRETMMLVVAYLNGTRTRNEDVEEAKEKYWSAFTTCPTYSDAEVLLAELTSRRMPLILMTASDCILRLDASGQFEYDPSYSATYKMKRLERLPFTYNGIVIGDPEDKPSDLYFDKVERLMREWGLVFLKDEILFIGDSEQNDLVIPRKRGYPTILINR